MKVANKEKGTKIKVLIHMGDSYSMDNPCTKRMRAIRDELEKRGDSGIIVAPYSSLYEREEKVVYCPTIPLKRKNTLYRLLNSSLYALTSIFVTTRIHNVDIVITTCPPPLINMAGWFIAKCKRAKLIYDVRDIWPDVALEMGSISKKSIYAKTFSFIRNFMLKKSDLTIAVSKGKVKKLYSYEKTATVLIIPNGFDLAFLENTINVLLKEKLEADTLFKCVYIGNLGLAQGIEQLLYIAEKAQESELKASFYLYGSGAEEESLKGYVKKKKINNVHFQGKLPNSDMLTVLQSADVSFVPLVSSNLKDSIPTKLYEALGVGCPVLLVAEGDSVDIIKESQMGIAVKPNDKDNLWKSFYYIYNHKNEMRTNEKKSKEMMHTKYSRQKASKELVDIMHDLIQGRNINQDMF